jgi:hypothetical protein
MRRDRLSYIKKQSGVKEGFDQVVSIRKLRMKNYWFTTGNEDFSVLARKSRGCAEAYIGTPHK